MAGWVAASVVLAGCGIMTASGGPTLSQQAGPGDSGAASAGGTPVTEDAARILNAAADGQLRYRLLDGRVAVLVLGPIQQSGLGEPCRIGRLSPGEVGAARPTAYAFCRHGDHWYEMTPVVVSGY
jgi:hypothetical protein